MTKLDPDQIPDKNHVPLGKGVKFCMNCEDMDNLAFDKDNGQEHTARARFNNCVDTGNFDGDFCSRLFVSATGDQPEQLFESEEEDDI